MTFFKRHHFKCTYSYLKHSTFKYMISSILNHLLVSSYRLQWPRGLSTCLRTSLRIQPPPTDFLRTCVLSFQQMRNKNAQMSTCPYASISLRGRLMPAGWVDDRAQLSSSPSGHQECGLRAQQCQDGWLEGSSTRSSVENRQSLEFQRPPQVPREVEMFVSQFSSISCYSRRRPERFTCCKGEWLDPNDSWGFKGL